MGTALEGGESGELDAEGGVGWEGGHWSKSVVEWRVRRLSRIPELARRSL